VGMAIVNAFITFFRSRLISFGSIVRFNMPENEFKGDVSPNF